MHERNYGIIINVSDIEKMRTFYRDTLQLGAPVVDSNHWVEFQLGNGLVLGLKHHSRSEETRSSNILWVLYTDQFEEVRTSLSSAGHNALKVTPPPIGLKAEIYTDPEGNRFSLAMRPLS